MVSKKQATVAKYGNLFCLNLDKDNPSRLGNTVGERTSQSDHIKPYPDWLPNPLIEEAKWTVFQLKMKLDNDQIFKLIEKREKQSLKISEQILVEYVDKVDALIYIQRIIELGSEKGIDAYLGKGGSEVYRGIVISNSQKNIASRPRPDNLTRTIKEILENNPTFKWRQVLEELNKLAGYGNCIEEITDKDIVWADNNGELKDSPITGLSARVTRIKKTIST